MRRGLALLLAAVLGLLPLTPAWAQPHFVSGSIAANGAVVQVSPINGGSGAIQVAGAFVGTLQFECTVDGANFFAINASPVVGAGSVNSTTTTGSWFVPASVCSVLRVRASAWTSGTATIALLSKTAGGAVVQSDGTFMVQPSTANAWSCFLEAVTVTTQCRAAPAAGLRAYVVSAIVSNEAGTAQTLDLVFGTGADCATGTTALSHKVQFGAAVGNQSQTFQNPLVPTAANAVCVRPSAATAFGATLTGYLAP